MLQASVLPAFFGQAVSVAPPPPLCSRFRQRCYYTRELRILFRRRAAELTAEIYHGREKKGEREKFSATSDRRARCFPFNIRPTRDASILGVARARAREGILFCEYFILASGNSVSSCIPLSILLPNCRSRVLTTTLYRPTPPPTSPTNPSALSRARARSLALTFWI